MIFVEQLQVRIKSELKGFDQDQLQSSVSEISFLSARISCGLNWFTWKRGVLLIQKSTR